MVLSDLISRRRSGDPGDADTLVHPTKALAQFLTGLGSRQQPLLLDLGSVVGANVMFFGEGMGCKILVADLLKEVDRLVLEGKVDQLPAFFDKRFPQEEGCIDGILCWDVFDYLDPVAAVPLARQLTRILRSQGFLLAFFGTADPRSTIRPTYMKHEVIDQTTLLYRPYAAARGKRRPLLNRDIQRLFEPLRITEQFLLKINLREVLFRKPAAAAPDWPATGPAEQ